MKKYVYEFLILLFLFVGTYAQSMEFLKKVFLKQETSDTRQKTPMVVSTYDHEKKVWVQTFYYELPDAVKKVERSCGIQTTYYRDGRIKKTCVY